jgi:DNA-binding transcriptional ArsR family regulator
MPNQSLQLDHLFQALADPTRRAMVERLSRGPAGVSELARPLPMSLPSAMQHLDMLVTAGLVRSEKVGRVRTCTIEPQAFGLFDQWMNARRAEWNTRFDQLGDYVRELEAKELRISKK